VQRICQEILGAAADETVVLNEKTEQVLEDSLIVLASKQIKLTSLSSNKKSTADDQGDDEGVRPDPAATALVESAKKAITQTVKQEVLEYIIPTIKSSKILLKRKKHNRLLYLLKIYQVELIKDHKEVKDILATDRTLLTEIEYDLKKKIAPVTLPTSLK